MCHGRSVSRGCDLVSQQSSSSTVEEEIVKNEKQQPKLLGWFGRLPMRLARDRRSFASGHTRVMSVREQAADRGM